MSKEKTSETSRRKAPLEVKILGWFGIILACTYLLWGIVSIVLSILDRTYKNIEHNIAILIYGLIIITFSVAFKGELKWGWFGYFAVLLFMVVWSGFRYSDVYGIIWGVLSLVALVGILSPPVRKHYF
ncbi:MAG: hypothetical protein JSU69_02990 [Candidatus Zixiibacteriota bacterium]|nr:MAG: hypothetical protein JSU69_02990 [candidate division Zixibacteria bacterium]